MKKHCIEHTVNTQSIAIYHYYYYYLKYVRHWAEQVIYIYITYICYIYINNLRANYICVDIHCKNLWVFSLLCFKHQEELLAYSGLWENHCWMEEWFHLFFTTAFQCGRHSVYGSERDSILTFMSDEEDRGTCREGRQVNRHFLYRLIAL